MDPIRRRLLKSGAVLASVGSHAAVRAQEAFPSKPIQLVVPFASGGGNDVMARLIAPYMAAKLGQPVYVENKPGAGGNIGAQMVARSAPDGHTLLLATNTLTLNPFLLKNIPFDVTKDFAPVARVANQPIVVVVNPKLPANTIEELVAYLKANPDKVSYASPGNGTPHHFATEMFKQVAGVSMVHVPYRGAAPALTDLIGGNVQVMFASIISALPYIKDGRVRAIATAEGRRLSALKEVPTIKQSGYPSYEATIWGGLMAAAGTPSAITRKLADTALGIVQQPEVIKQMEAAGFEIAVGGPDELQATLRTDLAQWGKVAKSIGMVAE
ncbi:MAG: tripartite tricarboxylate transporter substrate binding protein [Burkholderiales bacterium]|nr:tripartite tricarboxylate transporter substrate binding protein [Burkholderiales bacterium]